MKLDNLKFQIKHTTGNMLTANQQRPYQHCPQVKSHLSGSSSSPGYSQLMAEPSNSGGIQDPEVQRVKGHVLAPPRINLGGRRYDMRHEMLTQRALFCHREYKKGHADSAFRDACHTSSGA